MRAIAIPNHLSFQLPRIFRPRVLVVEDDVDMRTLLERTIRSIEPELAVDWVSNVPDAISQLNERAERYKLVLSDYLLDERGTGFDLYNWCSFHSPELRFAMMSAYPVGQETNCDFLPKPFSGYGLREFMSDALGA